ncbi:hypothetical protein HDE69_000123 [Pedobacter cryoconitis]|uniref:Uncharacterized protein n=1 Tax=Pedobacter cryoconitis TaxID=188932 RepID=A0A7W9DHL7_9SPHI|nr:hypothetical protein [Pedobacter cryoconitis]MBB5619087.1 hypothetical protein [Pedobacter cryoconitis]MBB5644381.1 hypothetical protein [Pedobacter cryoconitis]
MRKIIVLFVFLAGCIFGCKNNEPVKFINVYKDSGFDNDADSLKKTGSKFDIYYAYNYSDTNLKQLIRILDTLSFDTAYSNHNYRFLRYNSSLPDTAKLKKAMNRKNNNVQLDIENPGSAKFYKYQILDFMFVKHYVSEGRSFPNSYTLTFNDKGSIHADRKYFLRDSITKKLVEVDQDAVMPAQVIR